MIPLGLIPPPPISGLSLGPFDLRFYGLLIAVGALLALRLMSNRFERFGGDPAVAEKAGLIALGGGFLGARIGYVIPRFLGDGGFIERPLEILAIWQGGLAFFGGLVGGALAVLLYVRAKDLDLPALLDAFAPALPLAQAIGRWGNYFNQELYGRPTDVPWALQVEERFRRPGFEDEATFHPTFLYESLWNLALVGAIILLDRARILTRRGSLIFVYLIGYGIGRGWIEALRIDVAERYFGLSRNNWIAIAVVLIGIVGLIAWERRGPAAAAIDEGVDDAPDHDHDADDADAEVADATEATDDTHARETPSDDGPTDEGDPVDPSPDDDRR